MKTAIIYARVSTEEQAESGKSIETQEKICRKWAEDNDYKIADIFKDEGKSATSLNRPALQQLLAGLKTDIQADAILIQDTDRLARNTLDHLTIKAILKKHDVQLISISQPMLDDSPEGNLIDTIIASVNAFQSQITGRKTSKVLEEKARIGWYPGGLPPIGYRNVDNPNPTSTLDKKIVALDENAYYVRKVFEMYAGGDHNVQEMADYLNKKNIKSPLGNKIHVSTMNNTLQNPFYIGKFMWNGNEYLGLHEHLVSDGVFEKIQSIIHAHNHYASRKRKHNYLLRGTLFCDECGNRYWAEKHTKKNGVMYDFYFCSHCKGTTYVDIDELELQVEKIFEKIELGKDYTQHVMDTAKRILQESRSSQESDVKRLQAAKTKIEKAMRETEDDRFVNKTLTPDAFQRIYARYEGSLKNIEGEMKSVRQDYSRSLKTLEQILLLAENIGYAYKSALPNLKRQYLGLFIKKLTVRNKKIIKYVFSDNLKELIENGSIRVRKNGLPREDSNLQPTD